MCQNNNRESHFKVMIGGSQQHIALDLFKARKFQSLLLFTIKLYLFSESFGYIFNYLSLRK
jgi:hypothetical protein